MTTLIGYRWKCSDAWSRVVLITRKLLAECREANLTALFASAKFSLPTTCQPHLPSPRGRKDGPQLLPFGEAGRGSRGKELLVAIARGITSSHSEQRS